MVQIISHLEVVDVNSLVEVIKVFHLEDLQMKILISKKKFPLQWGVSIVEVSWT
jgi:hypothetical protein